MNQVVGRDDLLLLTLDTLRHDVAVELAAAGRLPNLAAHLPGGTWEKRHAPGSFTYASHQAMFAGFLPTPASPGPHPRLFAARFAGSETTADGTYVFDTPDLVSGLAAHGYRTVCIGGVGFFNKQGALGDVLPGFFQESHWEPEFSVASPTSFEAQVARAEQTVSELPPEQRLFLFLNTSALHQPNWFHLPGATREAGDSHDYAVSMREIRGIIDDYTATEDFSRAPQGRWVDEDEARRRHLLQAEGMPVAEYRLRFGSWPYDDFPAELDTLAARGWLDDGRAHQLRLSAEGLAHSDAIGPEFFSPDVRDAMAAYETK
jgi:hypothetical protein